MTKLSLVSFAFIAALGVSAVATAQSNTPTAPTAPTAPSKTDTPAAAQPATPSAPGYHDRNCVQSTGSLIPAKKGDCLNVTGRSYNQEDLQRTGALTTREQLLKLDPSVSAGH
jgi:hypothetical protein